jgi:glycosyltransferase involved in cell wall biosynthesis
MNPNRGPLTVCHVITGFDAGGAERILLRTAQRLDQKRFPSHIVSLRPSGSLSLEADRLGVEVIHLGMGRRPGPVTIWQLARLFRGREVDIAHAYLYDASIATRIAGRLARTPVIVTSTRAALSYLPRWAWWLDRVTARWCQRIIAVSRGTAAFVIEREGIPHDKVVVIPNGVDLERFRPGNKAAARSHLRVSTDAFVVACVGRLHPQKGHRYLFDAMVATRSRIPGLLCLMAGDGPLRGVLEAEVQRRGLETACRFLGVQDPIQPVYDAADVTVLPSLYEGMPNVVLEAMAMGCPVIATAVEGSVDLVEPGVTGLLVPPADAPALGRALLELAGDPERCRAMRAAARIAAERSHGIDRMVRALESLYTTEWDDAMGSRAQEFARRRGLQE